MYDQAQFYLFEFESNNQDAIEVQTPLIQLYSPWFFIGSRLIGEITDKQFYVQVRISLLLFRNNLADLGLIPSAEFALGCCLLELSMWGQRGVDASDVGHH